MNRTAKRHSRTATAYARLAAKAWHAGNMRDYRRYNEMAEKARRLRDRASA